jgi:hypothetical protein
MSTETWNMNKAARELLVELPAQDLVARLLEAQCQLAELRDKSAKADKDFANLERQLDAVREILWLEVHDAKTRCDVVSMANAARERLRAYREDRELPF